MRAAVDAAGGSGDAFAVMGSLRLRRRGDKTIDLAATMDPVPGLVESGVTDFRLYVPVPDSYAGARDTYTEIVAAFRETSGQ